MKQSRKQIVYKIINADDDSYYPSKLFDILIICLIVLSVCSVVLSTFDQIPSSIVTINMYFEYVSIVIFSIEYLLRIWTADLLYDDGPFLSRLNYIRSFMAIIDLLAILPFYLPFITKIDLRSLRTLRLIRLVRIFKLNRYTTALNSVTNALKRKKEQLISSMFVVVVLMIIASILMYYCEHDAQPNVFKNAFSGLWWAIATLTTVGYGDIYPITAVGKILSALLALLGIALVAVPTGIISSGFSEELEERRQQEDEQSYCPYCGKKLK